MPADKRRLPEGLQPYKKTAVFDQTTVPQGLLRDHKTRPGVWGLIHVMSGRLRYLIDEEASAHVLQPGCPGVVKPEQPHRVEPVGEVRFFVEFWRAPGE